MTRSQRWARACWRGMPPMGTCGDSDLVDVAGADALREAREAPLVVFGGGDDEVPALGTCLLEGDAPDGHVWVLGVGAHPPAGIRIQPPIRGQELVPKLRPQMLA